MSLRSATSEINESSNHMLLHRPGKGDEKLSVFFYIVDMEAPIHASNVMILDPKTNKRTRIGHTVDKKGNKVRCTKKSNEILN